MTYRRNDPDRISNYFDRLERGIGKRGSSFIDIDACTHDADTGRFLFREFKREGEPLDKAQRWTLAELARLPRCTVWFVRILPEHRIGWAQFGSGLREEVITESEYQQRFRSWWNNEHVVKKIADDSEVTAGDIQW